MEEIKMVARNEVFSGMTKAEKLCAIAKVDGLTEEMREFLLKEVENLKKKNSYKSKADKEKDAENKVIEELIIDTLTNADKPISTADIAVVVGAKLNKYISTQKVTPRCKALMKEAMIECIVEKGVNKYKAV